MGKYKYLKLACYTTNISMAVIANLSPLLFITFHNMYGITYSQLGLLVLANFVTQLIVDLIFSFFSHKFNIEKTVKLTPFIAVVGLLIYALAPFVIRDNVYLCLLLGTVVFSASGGLAEVLISPVIAALPAKDPDREMSKLHSVYAWGVVFVIIVGTVFILLLGAENWQYLALIFAVVPALSFVLFLKSNIPEMKTPKRTSGAVAFLKNKALWLCVAAIFLGGAAECTMAQWCSGYLEQALGIEKVWGDIFGVALFGMMLGLGRSLYSKYGKKVSRVLLLGAIGAFICYVVAALADKAIFGLLACGLTGFCVSMLWPGSLVIASERFIDGGVFIFAMMAAGGDLGASIGPQMVGLVTDFAIENSTLLHLANNLSLSPEQLGMKLGMLVGALFPLIAVFVYLRIHSSRKAQN